MIKYKAWFSRTAWNQRRINNSSDTWMQKLSRYQILRNPDSTHHSFFQSDNRLGRNKLPCCAMEKSFCCGDCIASSHALLSPVRKELTVLQHSSSAPADLIWLTRGLWGRVYVTGRGRFSNYSKGRKQKNGNTILYCFRILCSLLLLSLLDTRGGLNGDMCRLLGTASWCCQGVWSRTPASVILLPGGGLYRQ